MVVRGKEAMCIMMYLNTNNLFLFYFILFILVDLIFFFVDFFLDDKEVCDVIGLKCSRRN